MVERRSRRGVPPQEIRDRYPSVSVLAGPPGAATRKAWVAVFSARPDVMQSLLTDFIKQAYAQPGRTGQRPMPKEEEVDFQSLIYGGDFTDQPLAKALGKLVKRRRGRSSERAFVAENLVPAGISRSQYQRILAGEYEPNAHEIRTLAKALGKMPTFFVEYRKMMAMAAFLNLINERPEVATMLYRTYLEVRI